MHFGPGYKVVRVDRARTGGGFPAKWTQSGGVGRIAPPQTGRTDSPTALSSASEAATIPAGTVPERWRPMSPQFAALRGPAGQIPRPMLWPGSGTPTGHMHMRL